MSEREKRDIAAVEHCKDQVRGLFQAFMDGAITVDIAVSSAWRKMDLMLLEMDGADLLGTVRLRVAAPAAAEPPQPVGVLTCRCIGAQSPEGEAVYYLVVRAPTYTKAIETIDGLRGEGFKVRDWEFYA